MESSTEKNMIHFSGRRRSNVYSSKARRAKHSCRTKWNNVVCECPKFNGYISLGEKEQSEISMKEIRNLFVTFSSPNRMPLYVFANGFLRSAQFEPHMAPHTKNAPRNAHCTNDTGDGVTKNRIKNNTRPSVTMAMLAMVCMCWGLDMSCVSWNFTLVQWSPSTTDFSTHECYNRSIY